MYRKQSYCANSYFKCITGPSGLHFVFAVPGGSFSSAVIIKIRRKTNESQIFNNSVFKLETINFNN